jgi:AraC-like DNA-binding protein
MGNAQPNRGHLIRDADRPPLGLHRQALVGSTPAQTVKKLFSDLRQIQRGEFMGEDVERHLQGARVIVDRAEGHGTCDLYRLDQDLYVVATDSTFDSQRLELVPGEGLLEFHLRLTGELDMTFPGQFEPLTATGPCLLMLYQPEGVDCHERMRPNQPDVAVSLYCKPEYVAALLLHNSIARWPVLDEIAAHQADKTVWHRIVPLSPGLLYVAKNLLQNRYRHGVRLLYAEAKSLELICEVLNTAATEVADAAGEITESEIRQLESARQLLTAELSNPPTVNEIARTVGMSPSSLKRKFKARYGATVFDFGLDCRMRQALYSLSAKRMSVEQVAQEVGYSHQTSFASAFREYFGILPKDARHSSQLNRPASKPRVKVL